MTYDEILTKIGTSQIPIEFATTPGRAFILIAQLQLALRCPGNTGESAAIALEIIEGLTNAICFHIPEARELIEQGSDSAYDVTRDYFEAEFPFKGGDDAAK